MKAQLFCRARPGLTLSFNLEGRGSVIGRDPRAAVSLPTDGVSRRHARVLQDGKSHWIEDLKSTNGTFLNGVLVRREKLRHLDVVSLGKAVDLVFVLRDEDFSPVERDGIRAARLVPVSGNTPAYEIAVGEMTIGRSEACNLVLDSSAVSKQHVRLKRSAGELALEDLGSSNGTFVNGVQCTSTLLRHGDEISLGGSDGFRVEVEVGRITSRSGAIDLDPLKKAAPDTERPKNSEQWKTRLEWSAEEQAQIDAVHRLVAEEQAAAKSGRTDESTDKLKAIKRVPTAEQAKPRGVEARPGVAPPRGKAPARPATPGGAGVGPKVSERPRAAQPPRVPPRVPQPAAPPAARPATPAAPPAPPAPPATPPAPPAPPALDTEATIATTGPTARVSEVRLIGAGFDVGVTEPGQHQLGRSKEAALRVRHPTVSRRHAIVIVSDDNMVVYVRHDSGANGTFLNGRKIQDVEPLQDGDQVRVGEVSLTVRIKRA